MNSDKIYWQRKVDGTFAKIYSEEKTVGHFISTKAVGSNERNDITHLYKHLEGIIKENAHILYVHSRVWDTKPLSNHGIYIVLFIELTRHFWSFSGTEEERIAVETACSYGSKAGAYSSPTAKDISIEVTVDNEGLTMGRDAELTIVLQNSSSEQRTVILYSQVAVMYYTGVHKATCRKDSTEIDMLPKEGKWNFLSRVGCRKEKRFQHPFFLCVCQQRSFIPLAA